MPRPRGVGFDKTEFRLNPEVRRKSGGQGWVFTLEYRSGRRTRPATVQDVVVRT